MLLPLFVGVLCLSVFWYALLCVLSSFEIILPRNRELLVFFFFFFFFFFFGGGGGGEGLNKV